MAHRAPRAGYVLGSNNGTNWTTLKNWSGIVYDTWTAYYDKFYKFDIDKEVDNYQYFRFVWTETASGSGNSLSRYASCQELEFWGVPEYDPEAHGTDVTVKSKTNVPNTDWLEVYYDGQDYTADTDFDQASEVLDKSGNNLNGSQTGGVGFDTTYKAFTFDGVDDSISATSIGNSVGDWTHSSSFWFKFDVVESVHFYSIGPNTVSGQNVTALYYDTSGFLQTSVSGGVYTRCENVFLLPNNWYHITSVKRTNAQDSIYLNGNELPVTLYGNTGLQMSLPANTSLNIGTRPDQSSVAFFDGSIANFRLFNRALTSDEIYQLYAYQKEYFGHGDLSMTLKAGRLGIGTSEPRGALDVRGDAYYGCPVFFTAYYGNSGTNNNIAAGSSPNYTTLVFNYTMVNKGGAYNLSTGRCTFPISGYYEVLFRGGSASTAGCQAWIFRNGVAPTTWTASGLKSVGAAWDGSSGTFRNLGIIHFFDYFEAGEYLDVRIVNGSFNASNYNSFSVKYLSN